MPTATTVVLVPDVSIDPVPTSTGGILRGATITVKGKASCARETIDNSPTVPGEDGPSGGVTTNAPEAINTVTVVLGNNALSVAAKPTGPIFSGTGQKTFATWSTDPLTITGVVDDKLNISATAKAGNATDTAQVTVTVDRTPPVLTMLSPPEIVKAVTGEPGSATVRVEGKASDARSPVAAVEWRLSTSLSAQFIPASTVNGFAEWAADVTVSVGTHTVFVRARDGEGNTSQQTPTVLQAVKSFVPQDPGDIYGPAAYLEDLLRFVANALTDATNAPLTRDKISGVYLQRFVELTDPLRRAAALQPVYQSRLGVEVLRDYLGAVPLEIAARHRQRAHTVLLRRLGTSPEEIGDARGDDAARDALAARLDLDSPARLDTLLLTGAQLTEDRLQEIFGLPSTARDVMRQGLPPQPLLLDWKLQRLHVRWRELDDAARVFGEVERPVIEPDLLGEADFRTPRPGDPAFKLWTDRRQEVTADLNALRAKPRTVAGFEDIVDSVVAPLADLRALLDDYNDGADVSARLADKRLTLPAFLRLMRCDKLVRSGSLTDADWADVYAIAAYVQRIRQRYGAWRAQERAQAVDLSPAYFVPSDVAVSPESLPRWRASAGDRRAWQTTLRARAGEQQDLVEAYQSIVDGAELEVLPALRSEMVGVAKKSQAPPKLLLRDLRIDLDSASALRTTRLHQAISTLQEVAFGVRVGAFKQGTPQSWKLKDGYTEATFDADWQWYGAFETWRGGVSVFYYPDGHLDPARRPDAEQTAAFKDLLRDLRALGKVTPAAVRAAATTYLGKVRGQVPGLPAGFVLTDQMSDKNLTDKQALCKSLFGTLTNPYQASRELKEVFYFVPLLCAIRLQRAGEFVVALDWFQAVYAYHLPPDKQRIYHGLVLERNITTDFARHPNWPRAGLDPFEVVPNRAFALARFAQISLVRCLIEFADAEYANDTDASIARARSLYGVAGDVLSQVETATAATVTLPEDPVITALRAHVESNLTKLRNGLNRAGLERPSPVEGGGGIAPRQPSPYRFATLILRAKELAQLAGQAESAMLAALEKRDAEALNLLQAEQGLQLAQENVALRDLGVTQAVDGVRLASLQQDRAQIQAEHFQELLERPVSGWEAVSVGSTFLSGAIQTTQAIVARDVVGGLTSALSTVGSFSSAMASFERREQEWQLGLALARQDAAIGAQQVTLAVDQVAVARQEASIARLQGEHARATANFLANKFTGVELYEFMSGVLIAVYRSLLQQATAIARLAQAQLAFERQEPPRSLVRSDYWEVPVDGAARPDRNGLTGSARLLADVVELDQQAFFTDRRRLQLTKILSLARLAPVEFERFRQTGVLVFGTPQELFDLDFPGHYLRLIKRVRTSVVALVPPNEGIRATLSTPGTSRVVVDGGAAGGGFRTVLVRRAPETVALSSPRDATGLFELGADSQPELLLPFEGAGVDAVWRLELPRAANPFDFSTIADVLVTIDYTALNSLDYRQQTIQALDPFRAADRPFSLRDEFPDQWYDLNNPEQSSTPMSVRFATNQADFPPNLAGLDIRHLVLYFARADGTPFEISGAELLFTPEGGQKALGGAAGVSIDGVVSTRRPNAPAWREITDGELPPFGVWQLKLPDTARDRFDREEIEDVLLVVTCAGRLPSWSA